MIFKDFTVLYFKIVFDSISFSLTKEADFRNFINTELYLQSIKLILKSKINVFMTKFP